MKLNKKIDYKKEALDLLFKLYSRDDEDIELVKTLSDYGVPESKINGILSNYAKLRKYFEQEVVVPKNIIPFITMKTSNISLLTKLYLKRLHSQDLDYKQFLNRFFEVDLAYKEDHSSIIGLNEIINIVNSLDIDDTVKLNLINFYNGGEDLYFEIMREVDKAAEVFEKYYHLVEHEVEELYKELLSEEQFKSIYKDYVKDNEIEFKDANVNISVSIYNYVVHNMINDKQYIYIGFLSLKLNNLIQEYNNDEEDALSALKSLSDPTRYKILKILSEKKTYGNEIASLLNLSAATINHHLNTLLNNQLVKMCFDGSDNKKVYYEINRDTLEQVINVLRRNLL